MFSNHFITNFPQNAPVKKFENRSIFYKDGQKRCGLRILGPTCRCHKQLVRTKHKSFSELITLEVEDNQSRR